MAAGFSALEPPATTRRAEGSVKTALALYLCIHAEDLRITVPYRISYSICSPDRTNCCGHPLTAFATT